MSAPILHRSLLRPFLVVLLGSCLFGIAVGSALEFGVWPQTQSVSGPFVQTENNKSIVQVLTNPPFFGLSSGGDTNGQPRRSQLSASANQVPLGPPHSQHADIINAGGGSFSHWSDSLIFSLPPGIENNEHLTLKIRYYWRFSETAWVFVILGAAGSLGVLLIQARAGRSAWPSKLLRCIYLFGTSVCLLACLPLGLFLLLVCWSVLSGQPERIAGIVNITGDGLLVAATQLPQVLITAAAVVYLVSFGVATDANRALAKASRELCFVRLGRNLFLVVILPSTLLLSVARLWGGIFTPADVLGNMLGGSIPWNDASAHYWGPFQQLWMGIFPEFNMRRPLAACAKSALSLATGFQPAQQILLQVTLLGAALSYAVYRVFIWRGPAAGLFFAGVVLNVLLIYSPTHLSEPLGLFWAVCAAPAVVAGLKPNAVGARCLALFLISFGAAARMGNMFLPLLYALWVIYAGMREKSDGHVYKAFAAVILSFAIVLTANSAARKIYGVAESPQSGSNFAYVLVGLAHGGIWSTSLELYGAELSTMKSEREEAAFLYGKALDQIWRHPEIFLQRLWQGSELFLVNSLSMLLNRQLYPGGSLSALDWCWILLLPIALLRTIKMSGPTNEDFLWVIVVVSSVASAAFVMFDDGWRILSANSVYLGLAICSYLGYYGSEKREAQGATPWELSVGKNAAICVLCGLTVVLAPLTSSFVYDRSWAQRKPELQKLSVNGGPLGEIVPSLRFSPSVTLGSQSRYLGLPSVRLAPENFAQALVMGGFSQYQSLPESLVVSEGVTVFLTPFSTVFARPGVVKPEHFRSRWIEIEFDLSSNLRGPYFFEASRIKSLD